MVFGRERDSAVYILATAYPHSLVCYNTYFLPMNKKALSLSVI